MYQYSDTTGATMQDHDAIIAAAVKANDAAKKAHADAANTAASMLWSMFHPQPYENTQRVEEEARAAAEAYIATGDAQDESYTALFAAYDAADADAAAAR